MFQFFYKLSKGPKAGSIITFLGYLYLGLWNHFFNKVPSYVFRKFVLRAIYGMKIGKNSNVHLGVKFLSPWHVEVGDNVNIQMYSFIDGRGGVVIKDNVDITIGVKILSQQHDIYSDDYATISKSVYIGSNSIVGSFALIMPGVNLNDGAVLAAGSVLAHDADGWALFAGNPAVYKRKRNVDIKYSVSYRRPFH